MRFASSGGDVMPEYKGTDSNCFACGIRNENGLKLKFGIIDGHVEAFFETNKRFEGWDNIIHGGIISTLLDEAMSHAVFRLSGDSVVTAEMNVRFIKPVLTCKRIKVLGFLDCCKGRIIETSAEIQDENGATLAKAKGRFFKVTDKHKLEFC